MEIRFENEIQAAAPGLEVLCMEADIENGDTADELWNEIEQCAAAIKESTPMEKVRHRPAIDATRAAYKALGKDPNRYRPSAEALCRRPVKGLELYRTLTVIDLINLLSMASGHSIGGFDADKIDGDCLTLGVGRAGEPYEAIGRGQLNIEGLPVYRDGVGGVGTPTSDNDRTKLSPDSRRLLMTVNMYGPSEMLPEDVEAMARRLLTDYAGAKNINATYVKALS